MSSLNIFSYLPLKGKCPKPLWEMLAQINIIVTLRWCHNRCGGVSNHQPHHSLLNRLFRRRSKKTSKLRVTGLCVGNSPWPVNSPHKGPVTRKMFPFDDVIMNYHSGQASCLYWRKPTEVSCMAKECVNKIWWLCLVPTSTTRLASDVGYKMDKKWIVLYEEIIFDPKL